MPQLAQKLAGKEEERSDRGSRQIAAGRAAIKHTEGSAAKAQRPDLQKGATKDDACTLSTLARMVHAVFGKGALFASLQPAEALGNERALAVRAL